MRDQVQVLTVSSTTRNPRIGGSSFPALRLHGHEILVDADQQRPSAGRILVKEST